MINSIIHEYLSLKVVGIGGAGINAVNAMIDSTLIGVEYVAVATTASTLSCSNAAVRVLLPEGFEVDEECGEVKVQHAQELVPHLKGADIVILVAGMGGGTGTVITPAVAAVAQGLGVFVMAIVMKPFASEGSRRMDIALLGIERLRPVCDCLVVVPNDQLPLVSNPPLELFDAFRVGDDMVREVIVALNEQGREHGDCLVGIDRIRSTLTKPGISKVASAVADGEDRASKVVAKIMASPLLEGLDLHQAEGLIINVTGSSDLTVEEFEEVVATITSAVAEHVEVISGMAIREELGCRIKVTVIATALKACLAASVMPGAEMGDKVSPEENAPHKQGFASELFADLALFFRKFRQ